MKPRLKYVLAILLLATASCHKKPQAPPIVFQVEVTKPLVKDVELFSSYIGRVEAYVQVEVRAQVEGVLTGYYFTEGQPVKKGDLLFTIDSRPYEAALAKAQADLLRSAVDLRYAEDVAKRNAALVQDDFISKLQYDQYITQVLAGEANVKANEADIATAEINITYCNIHAPMEAITGKLQINVGNLILNGSQNPLVVLNQITPTYAYFSVPQKDLTSIMKLQKEQPLDIQAFLDNDYTVAYKGTLDLIDNQLNNQTGSIWLRGVFPNEQQLLWPGEFVDIHLITGRKKDAVLIPTQAISLGQNGKYVFVLKEDSTVEMRYIQVGQRINEMTLIEKGVGANDTVVTEGQINLSNHIKVTVKSKEKKNAP